MKLKRRESEVQQFEGQGMKIKIHRFSEVMHSNTFRLVLVTILSLNSKVVAPELQVKQIRLRKIESATGMFRLGILCNV